jgi:Tfp pilus assembly protein PilX
MISDASHDFKLSFAMQDLIIVLLISVGAAFVMLLQHRRARVHVDSNSATLDQTKPFRDMEHFDKYSAPCLDFQLSAFS